MIQKWVHNMWTITNSHLKVSQMRHCLSQGETTSVYCISLSACLSVTVLSDYLSQLAPRGHPHWKRPLFHSTTASVRESERGRPQSHQLQNSLIVTDAINRNLHYSQHDRQGFTLHKRRLLCIGAIQKKKAETQMEGSMPYWCFIFIKNTDTIWA